MKNQMLICAGFVYVLLLGGFTMNEGITSIHGENVPMGRVQNTELEDKKSLGDPLPNLENVVEGFLLQDNARTILIEIVPELMKYDTDTFTVKAGEKIILELDNLDGMQHNLLIIKPGTLEKVGAAADAMLRDPGASEKFYVPDMPEVLFATEMLGPEELYTLNFTVPDIPGDYPFVCTFPGHWRMMNGIMRVEKN